MLRKFASQRKSKGRLIVLSFSLALCLLSPALTWAQHERIVSAIPERFEPLKSEQNDGSTQATIDELIRQRIDKEWNTFGPMSKPELLKTEANYVRIGTGTQEVLYEASFHLQPQYYNHAAAGPDTSHNVERGQSVMYYVGSARTPLALPVVSNLSKSLSGDEASYTVNLGILPLPYPGHRDSIRYYIVIERAIESNHTDNSIRFEGFSKEFAAKADEPVPIRLAGGVLEKGIIVKLENGQSLDFYDDFARFIEEHILISGERLKFALGRQTISDISSKLSIPYSVASTCNVKVQLLSVLDTAQALTIVDTVRQPADYLAEYDMKQFADGPYRYRLLARDIASGALMYDSIASFRKATPVLFSKGNRLGSDTLLVGGKKRDMKAEYYALNIEYNKEKVINERIQSTLDMEQARNTDLSRIVDANRKKSIADIHGRVGLGVGASTGDNVFVGIESKEPALALDVSFGFMYTPLPPYLSGYEPPQNISQFGNSPNSLGLQLSWIPVKYFSGAVEPIIAAGFDGTWTKGTPSTGGTSTASLISIQAGLASEPLGELHGLGMSLTVGTATGLGLSPSSLVDWSFKLYTRF